jgi:hypothetical protein
MPDEGFKLPGSSYEELAKVIRAYGHLTQPANLDDVKGVSGIHTTVISGNNGFLLGMGILEGGKKKTLTEKGRSLARALEHEIPEEVEKGWREIVLASEFCQKILSAVAVRNGMDLLTLQSHVAYSAGQPKTSPVMTGARSVIALLQTAGLLREEDGKFITVSPEQAAVASGELQVDSPKPGTTPTPGPRIAPSVRGGDGLSIVIQLQVQCTAAELDTLGPKLRALVKQIAQPEAADSKDSV